MKIALVEPKPAGINIFSMYKLPRLGLPILGALAKREFGAEVRIFFQQARELDWEYMLQADVVGISVTTSTAPEGYRILEKMKSRSDATVIMGGPHVTFLPEEALGKGADFVVRGEGEETFVELLRALAGEPSELTEELAKIDGISYLLGGQPRHNADRMGVPDLTNLPWPDLTLVEGIKRMKIVPVLTSRGCPYDCKFCSVTKMFGHRFRFRDNEDVLDELEELYRKYPKSLFFFYDDNFTASKKRAKELLEGMIARGITPKWSAQVRAEVADDPELMQLMKESNCQYLYIGFESFNPRALEEYRKSQGVEDIICAVKVIRGYGIKIHGMFVLGSDYDTKKTIRETVRLARKIRIDTVQFMILTPLPGTEVYEEMRKEGRILTCEWGKYDGHHVVYKPALLLPSILQREACIRAMRKFYSLLPIWRLSIMFRWREIGVRIYARHALNKWKAANKSFLSWLKRVGRNEETLLSPTAKGMSGGA